MMISQCGQRVWKYRYPESEKTVKGPPLVSRHSPSATCLGELSPELDDPTIVCKKKKHKKKTQMEPVSDVSGLCKLIIIGVAKGTRS